MFNMAKLFYLNSSPHLQRGDEQAFSFLVPLNRLFEAYVLRLMEEKVARRRVDVAQSIDFGEWNAVFSDADSNRLRVIGQGPLRYLATEKLFQLKPDISIWHGEETLLIADAKYKDCFNEKGEVKINEADLYQMLAYSVRYRCNRVMLVYPKMLHAPRQEMELMRVHLPVDERVVELRVVQVDLERQTNC